MASNVIISPNMDLPVPIVNVDPSPDWANNVNACLSIIDGHNHAPNSGVQINPDGMNINADLTFNDNNATFLRSVRFVPNLTPIALPTDIGCIYESGVDLYYNDGNGNIIRITALGAVTGAAGTITGLPSGTASAAFSAVTGTFVFQQATSTAANMDIGTLILRYPGSYPTPAGNAISLEVPSSISSAYALTLPALAGTALEFMTLTNTGVMASVAFANLGTTMGATGANSIGAVMTSAGADPIGVAMTSVGADAVAASRIRATGSSTEGIGGVAISPSCGAFSTSSLSPVAVTNLSVTLSTSGRPIWIGLIGVGNPANLAAQGPPGTSMTITLSNGATIVTHQNLLGFVSGSPTTVGVNVPSSSFNYIDVQVAGTYTYTVQIFTNIGSGFIGISNSSLVAYEL